MFCKKIRRGMAVFLAFCLMLTAIHSKGNRTVSRYSDAGYLRERLKTQLGIRAISFASSAVYMENRLSRRS